MNPSRLDGVGRESRNEKERMLARTCSQYLQPLGTPRPQPHPSVDEGDGIVTLMNQQTHQGLFRHQAILQAMLTYYQHTKFDVETTQNFDARPHRTSRVVQNIERVVP
jgi:hypothetical protein